MANLKQFDDLIASRSLLKHPFYVKWSAGELTMDDMKAYAKEYFHLAKRVPAIVERVRDRAIERRPDMVDVIEHNLEDETMHIELWKRFAMSVGVSEKELMEYKPSAKVQKAVEGLVKGAEGTFEEGVATMYALERELPEISQTKKDGLCKFYGLTGEDAHIYFDEHLKEAKHINVWLNVDVSEKEAEASVRESLANQNQVLDAVCDVAGIEIECECEQ
ncbi:pyrroloquinoline quinone biosynthesis protein PqqC [Candidatus Peregrinibacteria bacterium CG10_big_fil_rev_8_21_14_0_10_49_24]|nr:MAG: pyrroloquinoline quinone biosynthesis protein PqqC [Candidatus Peregrinibacteria bacterium CG11_big_fil_rev_8_21_14_0_20_49_14]PIR51109.1 MAG: pyrroloquinoline quinone biosynthesis protein PqqC [Candidatus Peregrinibacteria bacterium CG10_big_fil_rev_8_21_14_0_10_49_24]